MRVLLIIAFLLTGLLSWSQDIRVRAELDTAHIRIGEQTHYRIVVDQVADLDLLSFPVIKDTLEKHIEVLEVMELDTSRSADKSYSLSTRITAWDTGHYVIRPLAVVYNEKPIYTEALLFSVATVPVDTLAPPKDIKPIIEDSLSLKDYSRLYWPWLLLPLAVLAVVLLLMYINKRRAEREPEATIIPEVAPHISAITRLEELQQSRLHEVVDKKPYYSELTEIIRVYLEGRYKVKALEQTSGEIIAGVQYLGLDTESMDYITSLLRTADKVKFAKERPNVSVAEMHLRSAFDFIQSTKPKPQAPDTPTISSDE